LAVWGTGNEDLTSLGSALTAIVEQASKVFGGLPYQRYLFLTLLTDRGRGGLEHRESSTLLYPRFGFRPDKSRQDFLLLAAHELFHVWIVKRLRPLALTPYRYRVENLTRLLWFFEGFTSYYEVLLCLRAGLLSPARFLEIWGERMTQLARTPGRRVQTLEEASLAAWVKFYRQDENSPNSSVSYYLKGSLVALGLEGELRGRNASLDQLLNKLWSRYGSAELGLPEDGVRQAAEELAQSPLPRVFDAVAGTDDPDYSSLEALGLRVGVRTREGINDRGGSPARGEKEKGSNLGLTFKADRLIVQSVQADGPAEEAGLCPDDELVAAEGFRLTPENCGLRLEQQSPGTTLKLTYFRREELRETQITLGERALDTHWIERIESPSEAQRTAFFEWTGARL
jgi:predicted metalloprotease with PDZ domain